MDGPAASGKGTLAKKLAEHYGLGHLDTGALYRAVARDMIAAGIALDDEQAAAATAGNIDPDSLEDPGLRTPEIGEAASLVAKLKPVRAALVNYQRKFAGRPGGAVIEGRDIGTVVCPGADVKIFVEASTKVRAQRRHKELLEAGHDITYEKIHAQIAARDELDRSRAISPLVPAEDALLLDTSDLGIEAAFKAALELIETTMR
ncbi:MAG: (d)CMP kinase, partial [Hyphomicrobiaceae bacterium]|nr:(d)CMP kinase [Hyphomicrobiaceae bacterium]